MTWRKLLSLLLLIVPCGTFAKDAPKQYAIYDFSKGIDSYHSSLSLPDGFVQASNNVFFDGRAPVAKRRGYAVAFSTKAYSYQQLWTYVDSNNTSWLIVRASDSIVASNLAGTVVKIATVSVNNLVGETNAFGNAYFVDQSQGVYYWNGSVTTPVSGSPLGSIITQFHSRLWVTGAAAPNGNQVYGSAQFSGTLWTIGPNPNDPVQLSFGLQDNFDNVTAEYVYLDTLYVFKHYGIFALYGFDQTSFQSSQLTQECGCIDGNSIQTFAGALKFVSLRGVENFDGYTCTRISDPVKNMVDQAIQSGGFSAQSWVQQNESDWEAGTITPPGSLSTTISPGQIVLSTAAGSFLDSISADFSSGTLSNVTVANNTVFISTNNSGSINDPSFEGTYSTNYSGTMDFNTCDSVCGSGGQSGSQFAETASDGNCGGTCGGSCSNSFPNMTAFSFVLLDASGVAISTNALSVSPGCGWTLYTLTDASSAGRRVKYKWFNTASLGASQMTTNSSYIFPGTVSFYYRCPDQSGLSRWCDVDNVQGGSSTITLGTFTSRTFDTHISSPILKSQIVSISTTSNTEPVATVMQTSANGSVWSDITTSTGVPVTSSRYLRYLSTFTVGAGDSANSSLNSVSLAYNFTQSSGSFKSQIHNVGALNSWGNFSANTVLNNGTIAFSICSSTSSDMSGPKSCSNQNANSQITIATGSFVQFYATFTVTSDTQAPSLVSTAVNWFSGSRAVPMASVVWDNRYWVSITTVTSDLANDTVLVLSKNGSWAPLDIRAGGFSQYKGSLYHSDSFPSGNVYLDNQGYSDNGAAINAYVWTKDYPFVNLAQDSVIQSVYPTFGHLANASISLSYVPDNSGVFFPLSSVNQNEYAATTTLKLPAGDGSTTNQVFGQTYSFYIQQNDSNPMWFYGLRALYTEREIP